MSDMEGKTASLTAREAGLSEWETSESNLWKFLCAYEYEQRIRRIEGG
jgi:hypothetical protein